MLPFAAAIVALEEGRKTALQRIRQLD